jgi:hypothetical protein
MYTSRIVFLSSYVYVLHTGTIFRTRNGDFTPDTVKAIRLFCDNKSHLGEFGEIGLVNVDWMLTECWLNIDWMLIECWLNVWQPGVKKGHRTKVKCSLLRPPVYGSLALVHVFVESFLMGNLKRCVAVWYTSTANNMLQWVYYDYFILINWYASRGSNPTNTPTYRIGWNVIQTWSNIEHWNIIEQDETSFCKRLHTWVMWARMIRTASYWYDGFRAENLNCSSSRRVHLSHFAVVVGG